MLTAAFQCLRRFFYAAHAANILPSGDAASLAAAAGSGQHKQLAATIRQQLLQSGLHEQLPAAMAAAAAGRLLRIGMVVEGHTAVNLIISATVTLLVNREAALTVTRERGVTPGP